MATIPRLLPYVLILLAQAATALAGACGDDVGGQRVACACGDVVVSDVRLQRSDPVVGGPCSDDGLIVDAVRGTDSVTVDLAGLSLIGGGSGIGVHVRDGGAEGAYLIGGPDGRPGQVAGFRVGVSARSTRGLRAAANLIVSGNEQDGLQLSGRSATIAGVLADENGRSGIVARGRDHTLDGVAARKNGHHDLRVSGNGHFVAADETTASDGSNRVTGRGNVVTGTEVER
jgi:hypothetical protein